jgi:hypothetical protein
MQGEGNHPACSTFAESDPQQPTLAFVIPSMRLNEQWRSAQRGESRRKNFFLRSMCTNFHNFILLLLIHWIFISLPCMTFYSLTRSLSENFSFAHTGTHKWEGEIPSCCDVQRSNERIPYVCIYEYMPYSCVLLCASWLSLSLSFISRRLLHVYRPLPLLLCVSR